MGVRTNSTMNIMNLGQNFLKNKLLKQTLEEFYSDAKANFEALWNKNIKDPVSKEDFQILKKLEMGQFGKGVLAQHKKNRGTYVMKTLDKEQILKEDCLEL